MYDRMNLLSFKQKFFVALQRMLPKHLLSRLAGRLAKSRRRWVKALFIRMFCLFYPVDLNEARRTRRSEYRSFNDFFTRKLKSGARPLAGKFCSPADGQVASRGKISKGTLIQSKGVDYSLEKLLATEDAQAFAKGSYLTIYLAPHNYHRVHAPASARLIRATYVPGKLFSVNASTAAARRDLFANNERLVMQFESKTGPFACVMVGAMLVGGIKPAWKAATYKPGLQIETAMQIPFAQGEELGWFEMGSTVVLVLGEGVNFDVRKGSWVKMGQAIVT